MRPGAQPTLMDLDHREVIHLECRCGRREQIPPYRLIGFKGIVQTTPVWTLQDRFRCMKCNKRPKAMWIAKWED